MARTATDLGAKLKRIEVEINEARDKRAVAARDAAEKRDRFAATPNLSTSSREFREADAARAVVKGLDDEIADLQGAQVGPRRMLGREVTKARGDLSHTDMGEPGGCFASLRAKSVSTDDVGSTTDVGEP